MGFVQGAASIERLREEIQAVRYREATTTFCRLVTEESRPLKDTIKAAIASAAPYVQVPSHLMRLPTGEMRGVNYDHTILGWRGAISLMGDVVRAAGTERLGAGDLRIPRSLCPGWGAMRPAVSGARPARQPV